MHSPRHQSALKRSRHLPARSDLGSARIPPGSYPKLRATSQANSLRPSPPQQSGGRTRRPPAPAAPRARLSGCSRFAVAPDSMRRRAGSRSQSLIPPEAGRNSHQVERWIPELGARRLCLGGVQPNRVCPVTTRSVPRRPSALGVRRSAAAIGRVASVPRSAGKGTAARARRSSDLRPRNLSESIHGILGLLLDFVNPPGASSQTRLILPAEPVWPPLSGPSTIVAG